MRAPRPSRRLHNETILEFTSPKTGKQWSVMSKDGPKVTVSHTASGKLLIHQSNRKSEDVIEITVGQAYDLLTVVSRALDIPVKGF